MPSALSAYLTSLPVNPSLDPVQLGTSQNNPTTTTLPSIEPHKGGLPEQGAATLANRQSGDQTGLINEGCNYERAIKSHYYTINAKVQRSITLEAKGLEENRSSGPK